MDSNHLLEAEVMDEDEQFSFAMNLTLSTCLPMVLRVVLELDLIEIISKAGPGVYLSSSEIASHLTSTNPEVSTIIDRLLRLLCSYSILSYSTQTDNEGRVERLYGLSPFSKFLTQNEDGVSLASIFLLHQDKILMDNWYQLKSVVLEGGFAFNKAHGAGAFEYTGIDPRFNSVFNKAMSDHSNLTMRRLLQVYNGFENLDVVVDVGGGVGGAISMITQKYPQIKGINFDLSHVIANAPSYPGVEHVGGDMFVSVPKGQAIFVKWILHDWTDEHCLTLLKNCWNALPNSGKVIIMEQIVPVAPEGTLECKLALQYDVLMLTQTVGGKERTFGDFEELATKSGFTSSKLVCRVYNNCVLEFYKTSNY